MNNFGESSQPDFTSSNYAYGSGGASGQFDIKQFLRKPQVICRLLTLVGKIWAEEFFFII